MLGIVTIISEMILLPVFYSGAIVWVREQFEQAQNRIHKPLNTKREWLVMSCSELALFRMWWAMGRVSFSDLTFMMLYVMLVALTVFCMTDLWEQVVPNKLLLILLLIYFIILGVYGMMDMDRVIKLIPTIILGFCFSLITFGLGFLLAKGSLGAGDVKLTFVMGLYLTGEYVVSVILYGCLISAVYSAVLLLRKKISRKDAIPFVPFLYIGLIIRYLIG